MLLQENDHLITVINIYEVCSNMRNIQVIYEDLDTLVMKVDDRVVLWESLFQSLMVFWKKLGW